MSEFVKVIETKIAGIKDVSKGLSEVLRDVQIAFNNQGLLNDTNWKEAVNKALAITIDDVDNEHEISSSFVEPSKSNKKYTTSVDNHTGCRTNDEMFTDDSNDSFEIPETQAFPPTDHTNDELDSEGYAMPDEAVETNDCSQSQALFDVSVLEQKSPNPQHFEDSDTIDLEMSKLQWDDSTKDNDKGKSASVTPELGFDFLTKNVPIEDLAFEALSSTVTKAVEEALLSPKQSNERNRSTDSVRNETETTSPSIRENEIDKSSAVETSSSVECVRNEEKGVKAIEQQEQLDDDDETQLFKMPSLPDAVIKTKSTSPSIRENGMDKCSAGQTSTNVEYVQDKGKKDTEIDPLEESHDENKENAEMGEADATQLFTKPSLPKPHRATEHKTNNVGAEDNTTHDGMADAGLDETQPFFKSNADNSNEDDDAYDLATQVFEFSKNAGRRIKINRPFSSEDEEMDDGTAKEAEDGNVPHIDKTNTESERPKLRKRNRIIDSSEDADDKPVDDGSVTTSNDDEFDVATQKFEICKPVTPKRKCIIDLQGGDWSQLCDQANSEQSNVVFQSIFDQCKDLQIQIAPICDVSVGVVAPTVNQKVVDVVPIRQSSRSKSKVKTAEWTEDVVVETTSSKRQRVRPAPLKFTVPANSSNATSTSSKLDDVNENATTEMAATQPFVKVAAMPKEEVKPVTRRQARSTATELPKAIEIKGPLPKLRAAKNQSVSYSPKPAEGKVSSDVNENIAAKSSDQSDHSDQSTSVVSSRSRKRKATNDILSLSRESNESSKSISPSRSSSRNQFRVMFTMIDPKPYKSALKELNITIVDAGSYDALITDKAYRTRKFLCALAAGKPIVSVGWLEQLKRKKVMPNPFEFLLNDADGEKKYKFQLADTLDKVTKNGGIFKNHSIFVTPNTSPAPDILQDIIASSGGKYLKTSLIPRKGDTVFCISDEKDKKMLPPLKKKYPALREITIEEFMTGIMSYTI